MISRVAEYCFWLSRYLERAENTARVLEVNQTLLLDFHVPVEQQWRPLLIICGIHDYKADLGGEAVQEFMTWDADNPCSIISSLAYARENARIIREVISAEMWERINYYHLWMQSPTARASYVEERNNFYSQIRRINQLVNGIGDATMLHGEAWEFFRLGKYLERSSQTARILDVKYHMLLPRVEDVGTPIDQAHWLAILMSCSGYEPFHKKPRDLPIHPGTAVAEFLIFEPLFPRSVRFCIHRCDKALDVIAGTPMGAPDLEVANQTSKLLNWLDQTSIQEVVDAGLHESLTYVVNSIHDIGLAIHKSYFDFRIEPATNNQCAETGQTQSQTQN